MLASAKAAVYMTAAVRMYPKAVISVDVRQRSTPRLFMKIFLLKGFWLPVSTLLSKRYFVVAAAKRTVAVAMNPKGFSIRYASAKYSRAMTVSMTFWDTLSLGIIVKNVLMEKSQVKD